MNMLNNMVSASSPLILIVCQLFVLRHTRSDPLHGLSTVTSYHLHFTDFLHVTLNDLCACVCDRAVPWGGVWGLGACVWGDCRLAATLRSISQAELQAALVPGW